MEKAGKKIPDIRNKTPQIVVLPNGFVVVGMFQLIDKIVTLKHAHTVRRWGTTKGLGEIALKGPTENTVLDHCGTVTIHQNTVIFTIFCDIFKWRKVFVNSKNKTE